MCVCRREREREGNVCFWSVPALFCLHLIVWLASWMCVAVSTYPASCLQLGLNSTAKISCLVASYHTTNLCTCLPVHMRACVWECVFKCYHEVLPVFPLLSLSKPSLLLFIHCGWEDPSPFSPLFSHFLPLSFLSLASTVLITHTPRSGPSFRPFEVILAQILLSYTADKTRKELRLRASGNVCVCVSFCWWNHQRLLFHVCLYLSERVYKRNQRGEFLCVCLCWGN